MKRLVVLGMAAAIAVAIVPVVSQAKKGKVIQPFPAVQNFSKAELKKLNEQWAGKPYDFAPPTGQVRVLRQPDGSTFDAVLTGAEIGGAFETVASGHTVVQNSMGWWTYGVKSKTLRGRVVASKRIVGQDSPGKIAPHAGRIESVWVDLSKGQDIRTALFEHFRAKSVSATQAAQAAAEIRKYKIPAILLQTKGEFQPGSGPEETEKVLNGFGNDKAGTVTEFYMEQSYGQMLAEVDVYGPYQSALSLIDECHYGGITVAGSSHYSTLPNQLTNGFVIGAGGGGVAGMMAEAVPMADPDINYADYDNDGDGYVDLVFIIHSGSDMSVTGDPCDTWSHAISLEPALEPLSPVPLGIPTLDGVVVANANTVPELDLEEGGMNLGVVSHEMSHNLGEPDFYDTSYKSQGTGDWDNMAGGAHFGDPPGANPLHFNPLVKLAQAWIEPKIIEKTTKNLSLRPWEVYPDLAMVPLRRGDDPATEEEETDAIVEAHLLHFSSRSAHGPRRWGSPIDGPDQPAIFDRMLLNSGLIVWHFDDSIGNNNDSSRYRLDLEEFDYLDKTQELALNRTRGEPTDTYFDTATGLSSATRVRSGGTLPAPVSFSGTAVPIAQAPEPVAQPPLAYTFEFTVPNNPNILTMTVKEQCATEGGDWDLYIDELQGDSWVQVSSGATGACSESAGVSKPNLGGQYRARVVNWLATDIAGGFTGEVSYGRGELYLRPDTFDNEGKATGWSIGNVRPVADGVQISAEVLGPQVMTVDLIKDKAADVSPGFLRSDTAILAGRASTLKTEIFNNGGTAARNVVVSLLDQGTVLARKTIASIAAGTSADVAFPWTAPTEGAHVLGVLVTTASGESTTANNGQLTELTAYAAKALGNVLIVDDDDGYDSNEAYEGALTVLGVPYAATNAHPTAAELKRYEAVIWEASLSRMAGQLTPEDVAELKRYLEGGGRVWFSSPRLSAGIAATPDTVTGSINPGVDPSFAANYIGMGYQDSISRGGGIGAPTKDWPSKNSFAFKPFPGRPIQDIPKMVGSAFGKVTTIHEWLRGDEKIGTLGTLLQGDAAHGNFRTAFTGLNIASIVTPESQIDLVQAVMKALGITSAGSYTPGQAVLHHVPPVYALPGETQVFTAYVNGADVSAVALLYRTFGTTALKSVPMTQRAEGVYEATLDGRLFRVPGIEYAILAQTSDGPLRAPAAQKFGYYVSVPKSAGAPDLPYSLASVLGARFTPQGVSKPAPAAGGGQLPATGVGSGTFGVILIAVAAAGASYLRRRRIA
ncbi:MAG: immune inhibitor A domain-containing protein [Actinomycetota bacterium]